MDLLAIAQDDELLPDVVYVGRRTTRDRLTVTIETPEGREVGPLPRFEHPEAPDHLEWGYGGAGPQELARTLLLHALGDAALCHTCGGTGRMRTRPEPTAPEGFVTEPYRPGDEVDPDHQVLCPNHTGCEYGYTKVPAREFTEAAVAQWPRTSNATWRITRREILELNIEELDQAGRRAPVKAKGARAKSRRRGQAREDFVMEWVYWDAGTARLLPRLLRGRTCGPVIVTHRRPGPGKVVSARDVCPDTGLVRLSYGQARGLLDEATAEDGPGTGWDLHEWRHSGLTHLGESGASLPLLMAKSRHKKPEHVRRYFHPSHEALAEVTSLLAPGGSRR